VNATLVTLKRLGLGYCVGCLPDCSRLADRPVQISPGHTGLVALGLQTLPSVCWAPLALLWFGQTEAAMFFIVVMGTLCRCCSPRKRAFAVYAYLRPRRQHHGFQRLAHLDLRHPARVAAVRRQRHETGLGLRLALIDGSGNLYHHPHGFGLGNLLHYGRELNAMDQVIGIMLVIVVIGLLTDKIVFAPFEKFMHRRWVLRSNV